MDPVDISVPPSRAINASSPLTGGGDLSADRTILFANQDANEVLCGPVGGGAPDFRTLTSLLDSGISSTNLNLPIRGGAVWQGVSLTSFLDSVFGSTRGMMLRRGSSAWEAFAVGADNRLLTSDGTDPGWETLTSLIDGAIGSTRGAILYRGASGWAILAPSTAGFVLTDGGSGADPSWAASGGGDFTTLSITDTSGDGSITYTVPANTLGADGDSLLIFAAFNAAGVGSNPRLRFGGTSLQIGTNGANPQFLIGLLTRLDSSSQRYGGTCIFSSTTGSTPNAVTQHRATAAIDLTASADLVADFASAASDRDTTLLAVYKLAAP